MLEALDEFFEETVNVTPIGEPLFPPITTQQVNAALQTVESGVEATTYTFRRAYIRRMAAHCMLDDGTVDLERLKRYTLHVDTRMLRAYYLPSVSDQVQGLSESETRQ